MYSPSRPQTPEQSTMSLTIKAYEPLTPITPTHKRHRSYTDLSPIRCQFSPRPGEFRGELTVSTKALGVGTFSEVYTAHSGARRYALKKPRKNVLVDVFHNELETLRAIGNGHPHIVHFWGTWHGDGLVFDWYETDVERAVLQASRAAEDTFQPVIGLERWNSWARGLSSALAYLHNLGIVHADLKPNNLLVNVSQGLGVPVIADFSYAKRDGAAIGVPSPVYSAPELRGGNEPTASSDIYALGVVLAFCATGQEAYTQAKNSYQRAMWQQSMAPLDSFDDELALRLWPVRAVLDGMISGRRLLD